MLAFVVLLCIPMLSYVPFVEFFSELDASYFIYFVASLDSTVRTRNANSGDWQEEVHQKVLYIKLHIYKVAEVPDGTVFFELN